MVFGNFIFDLTVCDVIILGEGKFSKHELKVCRRNCLKVNSRVCVCFVYVVMGVSCDYP